LQREDNGKHLSGKAAETRQRPIYKTLQYEIA
jgi:hypothetical protein